MIVVKGLSKLYGTRPVLQDVSFIAETKHSVAVLGRAGAGKSTLLGILAGAVMADEGSVVVSGYDIRKRPRKAKALLGYMAQCPDLFPELTVEEYLSYESALRGKAHTKEAIARVLETVEGEDLAPRLIANLSPGMRRRAALAGALVGDPPILLVDEPTRDLEPASVAHIRHVLRKVAKERTLVLATSALREGEELCREAVILHNGRVTATGPMDSLRTLADSRHYLRVRLQGETEQIGAMLSALPGLVEANQQPSAEPGTRDYILASGPDKDLRRDVWRLSGEYGVAVLEMRSLQMSLDEIFLQLTGQEGPS